MGSGIRTRNLAENSRLALQQKHGVDVLVPMGDDEFILASTPITYNTTPAPLTLSTVFTGTYGNCLPWPCRIKLVMRNRAPDTAGAPGITQCTPTFAGSSAVTVRVTGKLGDVTQIEDVTLTTGTAGTISGVQRQHRATTQFYDYITSIELVSTVDASASTWGSTTPLQLCAGMVNCTLGDAPPTSAVTATDGSTHHSRAELLAPFRVSDEALLRRMVFLDDTDGAQVGSGQQARVYHSRTPAPGLLLVPSRATLRWVRAATVTGTSATDVINWTSHGLKLGDIVRFAPLSDGLPPNIVPDTNYYVAGAAASKFTANTFALKATASDLDNEGAGLVDITDAGIFASGDPFTVYRPARAFRNARLLYANGVKAEGI